MLGREEEKRGTGEGWGRDKRRRLMVKGEEMRQDRNKEQSWKGQRENSQFRGGEAGGKSVHPWFCVNYTGLTAQQNLSTLWFKHLSLQRTGQKTGAKLHQR